MTKGQLYKIDQHLCDSLPAGPWRALENRTTGFIEVLDSNGRRIARVDRGWDLDWQTAQFIAQARLDLGALVEEVLGCWERIRSLEEEVERLLHQWQTLMPPEEDQEVGR